MARDAAKDTGLNQDQIRELHNRISGQEMTYQQILQEAKEMKAGN